MLRRLSRRQKAALTAGLALLLAAPSGISTTTTPLVTGHSMFFQGTGFDPCLASIVGVLRTDVRWFNDMVLVERYGGKGSYVFITENGADDPREKQVLFSDGVTYEFKDPNGAFWSVQELWWTDDWPRAHQEEGDLPNEFPAATTVHPEDKYYVWVVEISSQPIYDLYAPTDKNNPNYHTVYNFVALVDTCRFHREDAVNNPKGNVRDPETGDQNYTIQHPSSEAPLDAEHGHKPEDGNHTHEAFLANVYVGKKPVVVRNPNVNQAQPGWEDTWAGVGVG